MLNASKSIDGAVPQVPDVSHRSARTARALDGVRVLVVDDHAAARAAITAVLEGSGADVVPVGSGAAALAEIPRVRPDVLVSDIAMPDIDGHRLVRRIREFDDEHGGATPAAAVSAFATPADRVRAQLNGFQIYLAKPFDAEELVTLVARLAGRDVS